MHIYVYTDRHGDLNVRIASGRSGFDSRSGRTLVVKTGSDSSTAKRSALGVSVLGTWR